jgi:PAS domain S-box-containing protein
MIALTVENATRSRSPVAVVRRAATWFWRWLPRVELTPDAFQARHRVLQLVLWLHLPLVIVVAGYTTVVHVRSGRASGSMPGMGNEAGEHLIVTWAFVAFAVLAVCLVPRMQTRRSRPEMVSFGLQACADAIVNGSGRHTDMHFDFFVVLAAISLYQDLAVFGLAIAAVGVHHGLIGAFDPTMVYNSPQALDHPVWYALLHATFVLAMSAAQIVYWKFTENAQTALRAGEAEAAALAEELSAEKALLASVISTIPHLVYWKDENGRYAGANKAFLDWMGRPEEAMLGRTDEELQTGTVLSSHLRVLEHEMEQTGHAVIDRNITVARSDAPSCNMLVSVLPQTASHGAGVIGVAADVTHLAELEQQLAQALRLEAIGQLAAGIAHEINTPVQFVSDNTRFVSDSLRGLLPMLRTLATASQEENCCTFSGTAKTALAEVDLGFIADEVPAALDESLEGLTRIGQIVVAMKEFSHPGMSSAPADLNRAVATTAQVSRNEWKYLANLKLDLDPDVGVVNCHQGEIKQVLLNMIVNAAHAVAERRSTIGDVPMGSISVRTSRIDDVVQIVVADDGIGMEQAVRQRVFDPFFTTKGVGKGTGQGLSLAHSTIVQKHKGTIAVESTYGVGTTFTVTLPAPRQGMSDAPGAEQPVLQTEGRS